MLSGAKNSTIITNYCVSWKVQAVRRIYASQGFFLSNSFGDARLSIGRVSLPLAECSAKSLQ